MHIVVAGLVGIAGVMVAGAAGAQVPQQLVACALRVADAERLACYDAVVKSLNTKASADASTANAAAARARADRLAGFGKPEPALETLAEIQSTLAEILADSTGRSVFILDNGQMWRQADGFKLRGVKAGTAVTVKRGALGSIRLMPVGSNRSVQVIRMR